MLDSIDIGCLYEKVLENDMLLYNITPEAIKFGIECMQHVYNGDKNLKTERSQIADYRDPAHRCAYLHKYAALHTAMVRDMLGETVNGNFNLFRRLVFSGEPFRICSLGGGPGTDVIGVLASLHAAFGYFECSATVVDYMGEWSYSFASILKELGSGWYGAFGNNVSHYLNWRYVGANLLKRFKDEVTEYLSTASLVTMIKFTSAAACKDTYAMIRNIFTVMKPGAALLFIDNDGGGFSKLIEDAAAEFNFISIFGPFRRENYLNSFFKKRKFGYFSCCKTTVTVHVLQKPYVMNPCYFPNTYINEYMLSNNFVPPRQSQLASPPTPFLYLGKSPDVNCNNVPSNSSLLPLPSPYVPGLSPYTPSIPTDSFLLPLPSPYVRGSSPYTPMYMKDLSPYENCNTPMYMKDLSPYENCNRLGYASAYDAFIQDENFHNAPGFVSPVEEIPQSPYSNMMPSRIVTPLSTHFVNSPQNDSFSPQIYTPDTQPRGGKRARKQGCFPLRIGNFRHHVANKLNQVKARARAVFKKKNKKNKTHPIFKL